MTATLDHAVSVLVERWQRRLLPADALDDWRIHPATLVAFLDVLGVAPGRVLDVGAGRHLTLSRALRDAGFSVVTVDVQPPEGHHQGLGPVVAGAAALPFPDGAFPLVVSRLFLGAPVSQAARRDVALGRASSHEERARELEHGILVELARVAAPGAWQVHHVLERVLFSDPRDAGLEVHWPIRPHVPTAPPPWRDHPAEALRYHLSGVLLLRKP
ncbi:MAG: hypothetical protein AB2A00_29405 [Myxococcota bacterium]